MDRFSRFWRSVCSFAMRRAAVVAVLSVAVFYGLAVAGGPTYRSPAALPATADRGGTVQIGRDVPGMISLEVDQTNDDAVFEDAVGLAIPVEPNKKYHVTFSAMFSSTAAGNGLQWQFVEPSGTNYSGGVFTVVNGPTGATTNRYGPTSNATLGTNVANGSNPSQPAQGWALFETGPTPVGTFKVQFKSENASPESVTVQAGSFITYQEVFQ